MSRERGKLERSMDQGEVDYAGARRGASAALGEVLGEVPDPRMQRGKRHPLQALLALVCVAMLSGCDGLLAMVPLGLAELGLVEDTRSR